MTTKTQRMSGAIAVGALATATLIGCSAKDVEPFKDAPRSGVDNGAPADLIRMPDGFSNIASKCDGPNRVYTAFHGDGAYAAVFVVKDDTRCTR